MKLLNGLKNWPDERKRKFSIAVAIIFTLILVIGWFSLKSKINFFSEKTTNNKPGISFGQMYEDTANRVAQINEQIFGVSFTTENAGESTSTGSSTDATGATTSTSTI